MPAASGLGVNTDVIAPNGATLCVDGSEHWMIAIMPRSVARFAYAARAAMWCERRITTVPLPHWDAIDIAASSARRVSHGPGSRRPSQAWVAARAPVTSGSPAAAIVPCVSSFR